jgi:hypothetical protein
MNNLMDRVVEVTSAGLVVVSVVVGLNAMAQINDGRINRVVSSIVSPVDLNTACDQLDAGLVSESQVQAALDADSVETYEIQVEEFCSL